MGHSINWFLTLPLYEEFEHFRAVHACWDHQLISEMKGRYGRNTMDEEFLHASMNRESFEGQLVDRLTRGTALKLPDGRSITAKDGFVRHFFRTKFWEKEPEIYDDIVFQPDPLPEDIAEKPITDRDRKELLYYGPYEKPLFIGHYWMKGIPGPITHNIACIDYSAVKYGRLVAYRMEHDSLIEKKEDFEVETRFGRFRLRAYLQTTNNQVHLALTKGSWSDQTAVPVRVNASMVNNDLLATLTQDAHQTLDAMFQVINDQGLGAMVFINQSNPSNNVLNRLNQLKSLQVEGTLVKAPQLPMDAKDFGIGAQILHDLGIHKIQLISNHQQHKRVGMIGYGLEITDYLHY
ncbi:MAG: hypothetical protein EBY38_02785 [Flavobacteriaceae bacterium]|nr:hypothetical protein [Flavobacteriaceae bacterium]